MQIEISIGLIIAVVSVLLIILIILTGYVKASTDEMIITSGYRGAPRFVTGRATIKVPFLERRDRLILRVIKIDVKIEMPTPTNEFIKGVSEKTHGFNRGMNRASDAHSSNSLILPPLKYFVNP